MDQRSHQNISGQASPPKRARLRRFRRRVVCYLRDVLACIGLLSIVYHAGFDLTEIISGSMSPTLVGDGDPGSDWVLCERVSYWFREPRRWEVVQYETHDRMLVAKRIVGLPCESVRLDAGRPVISGEQLDLPESLNFLEYKEQGNLVRGLTQKCGDRYFFLGDESNDSWDSRFEGPIKRESLQGRAWLIVWPPSRIGFVNDGS